MENKEKIKKLEKDIKDFASCVNNRNVLSDSIGYLVKLKKMVGTYLEIQDTLSFEESRKLSQGICYAEKFYSLETQIEVLRKHS